MFLFMLLFKVDELLKVVKTNFVVMKLAAGGHKHDSQVHADRRILCIHWTTKFEISFSGSSDTNDDS